MGTAERRKVPCAGAKRGEGAGGPLGLREGRMRHISPLTFYGRVEASQAFTPPSEPTIRSRGIVAFIV